MNINTSNDSETIQSYLSNELDELESDRHCLLENHELLENSDHSLLEDDHTHDLLGANSDVMMMQRHKEMLVGLVDSNHLMPTMKTNQLVNGFGMLDNREPMAYNIAKDRLISQNIMEKEALLRERSRNEIIMRYNEMLAMQHSMVEPKHFLPTSNITLETNEHLGKFFLFF